MSVAERAQGYG